MKDNIQLSDHFSYKRLLRFTFPSIIMMVFTSIYGVVDGFFISNYVNSIGFAAVNLILPFIMILSTIGFMIGTGGSALVAKYLGEGKKEEANKIFSLLIYVLIGTGIVLTILGQLFLKQILVLLGATEAMMDYCIDYGRVGLISLVPFMLQVAFQELLIASEKPKLGLKITLLAGCTNMVLDFLFVGVFSWGVIGAAAATAVSECIGGIIPLIYFLSPNKSLLRLTTPSKNPRYLGNALLNGASEFMTTVSMSLVNMIYNYKLILLAGEDGVAAYGVIMYVAFVFISMFIGYSIGAAPIISFNYGSGNTSELKNMLKKSLVIIGIFSIIMLAASELLAGPLSHLFVGYDTKLCALTKRAFALFSLSYLLAGFNIFASALFTALNNGLISAFISFSRVLLFQVLFVMILPVFLGTDGIWISMPLAEVFSIIVSAFCIIKARNRYQYY